MVVLFLRATLLLAQIFALLGWTPMGGTSGDDLAVTAVLRMVAVPVGGMFHRQRNDAHVPG